MIITETVAIDPYAAGPGNLGIYDDRHILGWKKLADELHTEGAKLCIQLHDFGRETKLFGQKPTKAPSKLPCTVCQDIPDAMTEDEISLSVSRFGQGARRAKEAGIDAIEIHGAHGYLIAQFLSPFSNRRTDQWGGNLEGRLKYPLEVIRAVRHAVGPDFPIIYRISADEGVLGGLSETESLLIAQLLVENGIDALSVSGGLYDNSPYRSVPIMGIPPALNVQTAEKFKAVLDIPIIVAGKLNSPTLAEYTIRTKKADIVAIGRGILCDPEFPNKVKEGKVDDIRWCISCNQACIDKVKSGSSIGCLMNPEAGRETEMKIEPAEVKKRVLVAGGGPGGLEAARVLALRGHQVILCEKSGSLGGQFLLGSIPSGKQPITQGIKYLISQVQKMRVDIRLNTEVTLEQVSAIKPDTVVIATGAEPVLPRIPGIEKNNVVTAHDVLKFNHMVGENILIIGGGFIGCETAELLLDYGRQITIVEMMSDIGNGISNGQRAIMMDKFFHKQVKIITNAAVKQIMDNGVTINTANGQSVLQGIDTIIVAVGVKSQNSLVDSLKGLLEEVYVIGDAKQPRKAVEAIYEGSVIGRTI